MKDIVRRIKWINAISALCVLTSFSFAVYKRVDFLNLFADPNAGPRASWYVVYGIMASSAAAGCLWVMGFYPESIQKSLRKFFTSIGFVLAYIALVTWAWNFRGIFDDIWILRPADHSSSLNEFQNVLVWSFTAMMTVALPALPFSLGYKLAIRRYASGEGLNHYTMLRATWLRQKIQCSDLEQK
jgi:hypothetical protein